MRQEIRKPPFRSSASTRATHYTHIRSELHKHLPAHSARWRWLVSFCGHDDEPERSNPRRDCGRNRGTFGAQAGWVGGVLDITAGKRRPILRDQRCADSKA